MQISDFTNVNISVERRYLRRCIMNIYNDELQPTSKKQIFVKKTKCHKDGEFPSRKMFKKKIDPNPSICNALYLRMQEILKKKKVEKSKFSKNT